jgi:ribosomal-protein-alanine N-acetyltransferase
MALRIEDASTQHLDRIYEIETECFDRESFSKRQIASLLTHYNSISLIARMNNEIVGFIMGMIYVERNLLVGHILTIDVSIAHRQKGIAKKLLQEIEKIFKGKGAKISCLEVKEGNIAALGLYRKFGYKKIGKLKNYYGNAHGIYLRKDLA